MLCFPKNKNNMPYSRRGERKEDSVKMHLWYVHTEKKPLLHSPREKESRDKKVLLLTPKCPRHNNMSIMSRSSQQWFEQSIEKELKKVGQRKGHIHVRLSWIKRSGRKKCHARGKRPGRKCWDGRLKKVLQTVQHYKCSEESHQPLRSGGIETTLFMQRNPKKKRQPVLAVAGRSEEATLADSKHAYTAAPATPLAVTCGKWRRLRRRLRRLLLLLLLLQLELLMKPRPRV
jgi:hypothetical protein